MKEEKLDLCTFSFSFLFGRKWASEYMCLKWLWICSVCRNNNLFLSSFMIYHQVCNKSNMKDATSGAELFTIQEHMSLPLMLGGEEPLVQ
jgi:hypothetical protein